MESAEHKVWVSYPEGSINLYTLDEVEPYVDRTFPDIATASAHARYLVDEFLCDEVLRDPVTVEQILERYHASGPIPRIEGPSISPFDASGYAMQRAWELVGGGWNPEDAKSGYSDVVETTISNQELVRRLRSLGVARTFARLTEQGELTCILRLDDGATLHFHRMSPTSAVTFTVAVHPKRPARHEYIRKRWNWTAALIDARSPEAQVRTTIAESLAAKEELLDLSGHGLTSIPEDVWPALPRFKCLFLEGNWLREVPPQLSKYKYLEKLGLAHNQLTDFPLPVLELENLTYLQLSGNRLTSIPAALGKLQQLQRLLLDSNILSAVPAELGNLKCLRLLALDRNRLKELPAELGQLTELRSQGITAELNWFLGPMAKLNGDNLRDYLAERWTERTVKFVLLAKLHLINMMFTTRLRIGMPEFEWTEVGEEQWAELNVIGQSAAVRITLRPAPNQIVRIYQPFALTITIGSALGPNVAEEATKLRNALAAALDATDDPLQNWP